jgi:hypothetical protein
LAGLKCCAVFFFFSPELPSFSGMCGVILFHHIFVDMSRNFIEIGELSNLAYLPLPFVSKKL